MNNKRTWILIAVAVMILVVGYVYWESRPAAAPAAASPSVSSSPAEVVTQSATQGTVPSFGSATAPLASQPDVNPAANGNPLQSIKTNPFQ